MNLSPTRSNPTREAPDSAELLIKEARRAKRLRRLRNIAIVFVALVVVTVISVIQTMNKTPSKPKPETVVAKFVDSMKHANDTRFVATYRVYHYDWMGNGVITMAQIPSPPGTKAPTATAIRVVANTPTSIETLMVASRSGSKWEPT